MFAVFNTTFGQFGNDRYKQLLFMQCPINHEHDSLSEVSKMKTIQVQMLDHNVKSDWWKK